MINILDVYKKEGGKIWHRKGIPTDNGIILEVTHNVASALSTPTRNVRFLHSAFDATGDSFVASDYQGNIFRFDVNKNRFNLVQRTGTPSTAIAFSLRRKSEFLVGMADYSLKCFDTELKDLVACMRGHESAIQTISIHASGRYALSSCMDTAQLWDLDTFQRKRKLNIKENVGIAKVFFVPMSNTILTCFKDDTIFAWEVDTMSMKYQLHKPEGKSNKFKTYAATRDGRILVGGGKSRMLHMWSLESKKLMKILQLPTKVTMVKHLEFLPDSFDGGANQVLGVLSQDGIMRFINVNTCKLLFDIGSVDDRISNVSISPSGRHIVAVIDSGNMHVYSVQALTSELNKPPPPLVKVLKSNKMQDSTIASEKKTRSKVTSRRATMSAKLGKENRTASFSDSQNGLPDGLSMDRLLAILKGYGEYPAKYRMFIWRSLLRLPENHAAYAALVDKGTHPAYDKLHEQYPIKSRKLLRVLQRCLSALAHWSPIFGETDFLPMLAFPFVKLFQNNQLVCFEIVATILVNWCQHWFEYFPNPPINMLGLVENVLAHHDKELLQHLIRYGVTSQVYAWPIMETLFSEVLTKEEWLRMYDNVFSNHPCYLIMLTVAYCTCSRTPLLHCSEFDDFKYFFHHRNAVDVGQVIKEAYRLMETTPEDIHPQRMMEDFIPLTKTQYPVFNKYPKFIVDYQVQERERIRQEETEYIRQRQASLELQKETERRQAEEEAWYRQQKLLLDAEDKRRKLISQEETKLVDQRTRLGAMQRELKMKELQLLDATRRKFLMYQQQQKESELARLDDEIRRKAVMRDIETKTVVEEADVRNMELQLQRKMFEQELHREFVEQNQKQKHDVEMRRKQQELEDRVACNLAQAERDREQQIRKTLQQNLAHAEQVKVDASLKNEIEQKQHMEDLKRESAARKVAELQQANRELEQTVHDLMKEVQHKREMEAHEQYDALDENQRLAMEAESRRLALLEDEAKTAAKHVNNIERTQEEMFERLRDLKQSIKRRDGRMEESIDQSRYLNETPSDYSAQFSLDRGRESFETGERELMNEVRRLREKLAMESRSKKPPRNYEEASQV